MIISRKMKWNTANVSNNETDTFKCILYIGRNKKTVVVALEVYFTLSRAYSPCHLVKIFS